MVVHDIACLVLAVRAPRRVIARRTFVRRRCCFGFHVQQIRGGAAQLTVAHGQADFNLLSRCRLWSSKGDNRFILTGYGLTVLGTPGVGQRVAVCIGRTFRAQRDMSTRLNGADWTRDMRHRRVVHHSRFSRGFIRNWRWRRRFVF